MKKFWKINGSELELSLHYLKVDNNFWKVVNSNYLKSYLNKENVKYIYICKDEEWGWGECYNDYDDYDYFIKNEYKYCGLVSLRKEKLIKILKNENI